MSGSATCLLPAVDASRRAGLADTHLGQIRQLHGQAIPDPLRENLAGRVLKAGDLVEVVMIQLLLERLEGRLDVAEVLHPTGSLPYGAGNVDDGQERVAVQASALVALRHVREPVSGL